MDKLVEPTNLDRLYYNAGEEVELYRICYKIVCPSQCTSYTTSRVHVEMTEALSLYCILQQFAATGDQLHMLNRVYLTKS